MKRGAIVYGVNDTKSFIERTLYFGTKREAEAYARSESRSIEREYHGDTVVIVEAVELVPMDRAAILRLINDEGGFVWNSRPVAYFKNGKRHIFRAETEQTTTANTMEPLKLRGEIR